MTRRRAGFESCSLRSTACFASGGRSCATQASLVGAQRVLGRSLARLGGHRLLRWVTPPPPATTPTTEQFTLSGAGGAATAPDRLPDLSRLTCRKLRSSAIAESSVGSELRFVHDGGEASEGAMVAHVDRGIEERTYEVAD